MQRDVLLLSEMIDAAEQAERLVAGYNAAEVGADRMRRESLLGRRPQPRHRCAATEGVVAVVAAENVYAMPEPATP